MITMIAELFFSQRSLLAIIWKLGFSREAAAKKSDQKVCAIMHVQCVQHNVLLVKNHCFFYFDKHKH